MLKLRTRLRDCLFLNWALPVEQVAPPELPDGLRLDTRRAGVRSVWLISALLFRQEGLRLRSLPFVRLSYPQANLRTYVIDADGQPAVFFLGMWVPSWVAAGVRLIGGQPAAGATFTYPPSPFVPDGPGEWSVDSPRRLRAVVESGATTSWEAAAPTFPSWQARCAFFRDRSVAYARSPGGGVSRVAAQSNRSEAVPVRASLAEDELVSGVLGAPLPPLESAMLYPEIRLLFELGPAPRLAVPQAAPAPV